jgi:hypothetical protein
MPAQVLRVGPRRMGLLEIYRILFRRPDLAVRARLLLNFTTRSLMRSVFPNPVAMPMHRCIFCSKSLSRPGPAAPPQGYSSLPRQPEARRIAVPAFNGRVSPVLDSCTQLYLPPSSGASYTANGVLPMTGGSIFERAGEIRKHGIGVIICGAVSEAYYNLLREAGIELVCGVAGDIDEVVAAYRSGILGQARFRMPGSE